MYKYDGRIYMDKHDNLCAEGFLIYLSVYEAIKQIGQSDPKLAFEYFAALADYNFYGVEYKGSNIMIKVMAEQQYPLIDKQRERYNQSVKGGQSKKEQIPWDDIVAAAQSGEYTTLQALGVRFGTSGQNIGRRLKTHNITLNELIEQGRNEMNQSKPTDQTVRTFETNDSKGTPFHFPETNPTNTNNNTNNITTIQNNDSVKWAGKTGNDRVTSLID